MNGAVLLVCLGDIRRSPIARAIAWANGCNG
jgi:protein-tyrosine-phosphatase